MRRCLLIASPMKSITALYRWKLLSLEIKRNIPEHGYGLEAAIHAVVNNYYREPTLQHGHPGQPTVHTPKRLRFLALTDMNSHSILQPSMKSDHKLHELDANFLHSQASIVDSTATELKFRLSDIPCVQFAPLANRVSSSQHSCHQCSAC